MPQNVEINWNDPTTIEGVPYPKDTLDRAKYAQYLSNFLASKGYDASREEDDRKRNYVLNLNSEWGSGKTYFLRRWAEDLKAHHPVVYVDAWQQDYSDDPLMAVISSMITQLREQAEKPKDDIKFKAPRKMLGLLKASAPAIAGGLAKRYLGIDPVKIMESSEDEPIGEQVKGENGQEIDMGAAASKMVSHLIDEHTAKPEAIESLKRHIEQWVEAAKVLNGQGNQAKQYPAFVFIDELDRCRPSYAVEMLETIKHIFNIKGVVFVVATDTEQLQHAVKAVYGEGFDAGVYLGRFFDARYTLKEADYDELLEVHCDLHKVSMSSMEAAGIHVWPKCAVESGDTESIENKNLATILKAFRLSARQSIQVVDRLVSVVDNLKSGEQLNFYYLVMLLCMKEKYPEEYSNLKHQTWVEQLSSPSEFSRFASGQYLHSRSIKFTLQLSELSLTFLNKQPLPTNITQRIEADISIAEYLKCSQVAMLDYRVDRAYDEVSKHLGSASSSKWLIYGTYDLEFEGHLNFRRTTRGYRRYGNLVDLSASLDV